MIVLDVNVLIYAHNREAPHHEADKRWLEEAIVSSRPVGLPLVTSLGFLRIVTNPRAMEQPLSVATATQLLSAIRHAPAVDEIGPASGHWDRVEKTAQEAQMSGAEMTDVHLAVLTLERGAALATHDRGFRRIPELDILEPG
ncbi:TA system VapC family ribonuclease toxin [Euzebya tangerina]|uniref:TA system VapC family ribonuclease toxin n=1 Tax=Euzebya tangerina TaxID=591198 RepID=UPI000E31BDD9|nr:TA system VapC family ribonuclease toxin [Euzebya tangerina]